MVGIILLAICTLMQVYVFWRATTVPWLTRRVKKRGILAAGLLLLCMCLLAVDLVAWLPVFCPRVRGALRGWALRGWTT